jgi:two-component system response regulator GlrR
VRGVRTPRSGSVFSRLWDTRGRSSRESANAGGTLAEARTAFERGYVIATLQQARGNMAAAARQAGLDRSHYFRLVRRHGIEPKQYASPGPQGR